MSSDRLEPETTAREVVDLFHRTPRADAARARWLRDPRRTEVLRFVEAHRTRVPYRIGAEELEEVCRSTDHALGAVRRVDAEAVVSIVDWEPNYAVAHVLHYALERHGAPFTWQWFRRFCRDDREARRMLCEPAQEMVRRAVAESSSGLTPAGARAAMRWLDEVQDREVRASLS